MDVLLVDGYNMIGDWPELQVLKDKDLDQARQILIEKMAEYKAYRGYRVIVVFDAYEVKGLGSEDNKYDVEIIYTREKETADECIERLVKQLKNVRTKVYVATSDYTEQRTIFQQGAYRKSARELELEIKHIQAEITEDLVRYKAQKQTRQPIVNDTVWEALEKMRRGE
ncbi:hypothetical protein DES38_11559 [Streptohalobacillus salinus]|uniref:RNA-binding protein with PIN domain n=1 Tax=Streptohalobacillus salinus TaxID=621096 RepID=A0A2V3WFW5_9BACI|nr:NYN domain-containing protein [Streptohalobacillus salinus]PXW87739.1 hypothetical protein DES38_11559 [Streptohalobacillus salinus]